MKISQLGRKVLPGAFQPAAKKIFRYMVSLYGYFKNYKSYKYRDSGKKIYLIGTPEHSNLGDHAIAEATMEFLINEVRDAKIYEISLYEYTSHLLCLQKFIQKGDIILINGGGNMGIEWFFGEEMIRLLIKKFPHNRIIIMPQTIFYGDSEYGSCEFEKSKRLYSTHKDLHIIAREKSSYRTMWEAYPCNSVYLNPDAVLYLNKVNPRYTRDGILICLRNDVEKSLTQAQCKEIIECCNRYTDSVRCSDTVADCPILPLSERKAELEKKYREFKRARLVVTDRLHGMVFCAITGTPCIALGNYNHKVKGVYEWIENLNYIRFLDDCRDIQKYIPELLSLEECSYENDLIKSRFSQITTLLNYERVVV